MMARALRRWATVAGATALLIAGTTAGRTAPPEEIGGVVASGTMAVPRAAHTATLLADGTVLVVGGCTVDSCELDELGASTERYDPSSGKFVPTGKMTTPRVSHTATRLPDGRVLIAGGWGPSGVLATAELYDPIADLFAAIGEMLAPRAAQIAAALPDGRVLLAGGTDGVANLASAEIFDPVSGRFVPAASMTTVRNSHTGVRLGDGRVLIAGGDDRDGAVLDSAEIYDPVIDQFVATGAMGQPRRKHTTALLSDGRVLVAGGSDEQDGRNRFATAEVYDPSTGMFSLTGRMANRRFKVPGATVALPNGDAIIAGGATSAELYDPRSGTFQQADGAIGAAYSFATATLLSDGTVLILGGYDETISPTARAWRFLPRTALVVTGG